jgi:hypothetical protein
MLLVESLAPVCIGRSGAGSMPLTSVAHHTWSSSFVQSPDGTRNSLAMKWFHKYADAHFGTRNSAAQTE